MGLSETLIFYLCVGTSIAVAAFLTEGRQGAWRTGFVLLTALLFWPLYVPLLISARAARQLPADTPAVAEGDEMAAAIAQVELELEAGTFESRRLGRKRPGRPGRSSGGAVPRAARRRPAHSRNGSAADSHGCRAAGGQQLSAAGDHRRLPGGRRRSGALAKEPARPGHQPGPAGAGPPANACRFDGHLGLDTGTGLDDPPGQVHRSPPLRGPKSWWPRSPPQSKGFRPSPGKRPSRRRRPNPSPNPTRTPASNAATGPARSRRPRSIPDLSIPRLLILNRR